jgi:hypothetical protein
MTGHTLAELTGNRLGTSSPIAGYRPQAYRAKFDEALKRSHG